MNLKEKDMEKIVVYQQNMCGCDIEKRKKALKGMLTVLKDKKPDIIFLSEVAKDICPSLCEIEGYAIIQPVIDIAKGDTAACLLMINVHTVKCENEEPQRSKKRNIVQLKMKRYIEAGLRVRGLYLDCFFAYIQQCSPNIYTKYSEGKRRPYKYLEPEVKSIISDNQNNVEAKAEMLFGAYMFWTENRSNYTFVGGDLNTDLSNKNGRCKKIFEQLYNEMVDTIAEKHKGESTWNGERLDYALISHNLDKEYACTTEYVSDTGSDHKGLLTVMTKTMNEKKREV